MTGGAMLPGYQTDCATAFPTSGHSASNGASPPCGRRVQENGTMSEKSNYGAVGCRHMFQSESGKPNPPEQDMTQLSPANAERLKLAFVQCRDMEGTLNERLGAYAVAGREIFPAYGEAVGRSEIRSGKGTGRRDVLSGSLVPLLQAERRGGDKSYGPDQGVGRAGCRDHARGAAIR